LRPNQISFSHSLGPLLPRRLGAACPQLAKADAEPAHLLVNLPKLA
jgi:hypothetical protein